MIFDLGFGNGDDTDYYLYKGHKVIALDGNISLIGNGNVRFREYINEGKLILINKAISTEVGFVNFYLNQTCSDWSSCEKWLAESNGTKSEVVTVETTTLLELCKEYGTPHYLKVDVEGVGGVVAKQLYGLKNKPQFISFETLWKTFGEVFAWLYVSGYKKFQLINQANNPSRDLENYKFTESSSGFFGKDLPKDKWISYEELLERYMKYRDLRIIDKKELSLGWLDVHASL